MLLCKKNIKYDHLKRAVDIKIFASGIVLLLRTSLDTFLRYAYKDVKMRKKKADP